MRQNYRRGLALFLVAIMALALLAACGGNSGNNTPAPAAPGAASSAPAPAAPGASSAPAPAPAAPGASSSAPAPAPAPAGDGKVYTMRIGAVSSPPTPEPVYILALVDYIAEATGGRVKVEAYHSGTLGNAAQMIQGLQDGSVDGVCIPSNYFESSVPELGILGLPMYFNYGDQAYRFCKTPGNGFHEMLNEFVEAKGFVIGSWLISSTSALLASKPVSSVDDFKGLKVWCNPNTRIVDALSALGAAPVNFDTGDLAVGMQQRTVDAAYIGPTLLAPQKLYESAKNLLLFSEPMNFTTNVLMTSKAFADSLPADLREILYEALARSGEEIHYPICIQTIEDTTQELINADGMTVVYTDSEFTSRARALVEPLVDKFLNEVPSARPLCDLAVKLMAEEG